jgi:hypothetical protein
VIARKSSQLSEGIRTWRTYERDLPRHRTSGQPRPPSTPRNTPRHRFSSQNEKSHSARQRRRPYCLQRPAVTGGHNTDCRNPPDPHRGARATARTIHGVTPAISRRPGCLARWTVSDGRHAARKRGPLALGSLAAFRCFCGLVADLLRTLTPGRAGTLRTCDRPTPPSWWRSTCSTPCGRPVRGAVSFGRVTSPR